LKTAFSLPKLEAARAPLGKLNAKNSELHIWITTPVDYRDVGHGGWGECARP
jgi:hypothetical protein